MAVIQTQNEIAKLGLDLGAVLSLVCERTGALTRASGVIVELAEGDEMVFRAATGIASQQLGVRVKRAGSFSAISVATGEALRCDDADTDPRVDRESSRKLGLRSMLVVPLTHVEAIVGVLRVFSTAPRAFDDTDLRLLELMADVIGAAMFHATSYDSGELFYRATHESKTGFPNRALFYDRLRNALAHARRHRDLAGVLVLDLDAFKKTNDQHGHRVGDMLIQEAGARLTALARESDTVARLGSDEFGIVLARVEGRDGPERAARRVMERLALPQIIEEQSHTLEASIGWALFPDEGEDVETLLRKADRSLADAKRARGAR